MMITKMPSRRELLSQVFLKDKELVVSLVEKSSVGLSDTVLEIGPGQGIITDVLIEKAGRVIAVEKDSQLHNRLKDRYQRIKNLDLYNEDILKFKLPSNTYKVFSNIPFSIEGKLVRKLVDNSRNPPIDTYLIMRREVAERMAGSKKEGQFSILHKPWFEIEIFYRFKRGDFKPKPQVESSMIRFKKRDRPLINPDNKRLYELFIKQGFGGGRRIKQNLSSAFSSYQLKRISGEFGFKVNAMPSQVSFEQWLGMFNFFSRKVSEEKRKKFISEVNF